MDCMTQEPGNTNGEEMSPSEWTWISKHTDFLRAIIVTMASFPVAVRCVAVRWHRRNSKDYALRGSRIASMLLAPQLG
jgi:hypothetical protein